jgi:chromosome segregation ATPase
VLEIAVTNMQLEKARTKEAQDTVDQLQFVVGKTRTECETVKEELKKTKEEIKKKDGYVTKGRALLTEKERENMELRNEIASLQQQIARARSSPAPGPARHRAASSSTPLQGFSF